MNITKHLTLLTAAALGAAGASAQSDLQLPLMYGAQATTANPAKLQDHKITVTLPAASFAFASPFAVNDVGEVRDGTLYLDGDRFTAAVGAAERNPNMSGRIETLGFNYRKGKFQVGLSHAVRVDGSVAIPEGLAQLATYGNGRYVGETLEVAPRLGMQAYQEFGVHAAYAVTEQVTIGARVKYLSGSGALVADNTSLGVYTDPDIFQATVTSDATLRSAGLPVTFDGAGIDVGSIDGIMGAGAGFGFDIGAVYQPTEKLEIGFSARDIGSINWNGDDAAAHRSAGTYTFEGYRGDLFSEGGASEFDVAAVLDSVIAAVEFVSEAEAFRTTLPTTVQATARYDVAERTTVDATVYAAKADAWGSGFGLGLTQGFGKFGQVGVLGGARTGGAYLGANLTVDVFGPQLYIACDNLLTAFDAASGRNAHVRAGLNLAFGAIKKRKAVSGFYNTEVEGINK